MDLKACKRRLKIILKEHSHAHFLKILSIHLENSTIESRGNKRRKEYTRVFDDVISVTVSEKKDDDDIHIKEIEFLQESIPAYLPMKEIFEIFENGRKEKEVTYELFSNTQIKGNFDFGAFAVFSKNRKLFLNAKVSLYEKEKAKNIRSSFALKIINKEISDELVKYITKILSLCIVTTIGYEWRSHVGPPQKNSPIKKMSEKSNRSTYFYHGHEQQINSDLIADVVSGYQQLDSKNRLRLKRALHWVEKNTDQTSSDYMLHIAIMIESLTEQVIVSRCKHCGEKRYSEGMTKSYVNFFENYSDLDKVTAKKFAREMYDIRCRISHAGKLLPFDDPSMKLRKEFFVLQMSAPRYLLARWILNWINSKLEKQ